MSHRITSAAILNLKLLSTDFELRTIGTLDSSIKIESTSSTIA